MTAAEDVRLLRGEQGRTASSIDWDRVITINYRAYVEPDGLVIDAGAGDALQSRRLRRYVRPSHLFLVEPDKKDAAKLRFQWARKRGINVVQAALGAEQSRSEERDVDRLDDWTLPAPLSFFRVAVGDSWPDVLRGAARVISTDRPVIGLESPPDPTTIAEACATHDLVPLDLFGNVIDASEFTEVFDYLPAAILLPPERVERLGHNQAVLRADVLRSIENYSAVSERIKGWLGV